jgi:hypothetical protein
LPQRSGAGSGTASFRAPQISSGRDRPLEKPKERASARPRAFFGGSHWIGLRENLQETMVFPMKMGVSHNFPLNQSNEEGLGIFLGYESNVGNPGCHKPTNLGMVQRPAIKMLMTWGWLIIGFTGLPHCGLLMVIGYISGRSE